MFGMIIDAGPKSYVVWSPTQYMTKVKVVFTICFYEAFDGLIHVWHSDRNWSKILYGTIPNPVNDL